MRHSGCTVVLRTAAVVLGFMLVSIVPNASAQEAEQTAGDLEKKIQELRMQARYAEAVQIGEELLALRQTDPDAKPYEIADAERLVETLRHIAGLPDAAKRELALADSLTEVGETRFDEGRYAEAMAASEQQLEIRRKLLGGDHPDVATSLNDLAMDLLAQGDYAGAEPLFREALAMDRKLLGGEHPDIAMVLNSLASLLEGRGDYAGAESLFREALAMSTKLLGYEHPDTAVGLNNLAHLLVLRGDYAGAEPLFRKALAILTKLLGDEHSDTAVALNNLAQLLALLGDYAGAKPLQREALATLTKVLGDEHPFVAMSLTNFGQILEDQGDHPGAERLYRKAVAMMRKLLGDEHPHVAAILNRLALCLDAQGDHEGAEPLYREALAIRRKLLDSEHPDIAESLSNLAYHLYLRGNYAGAEPLLRETLAMDRKLLGHEHPCTAKTLRGLGAVLWAQGDCGRAEPFLAEAADVYDAARLRVGAGLERATFLEPPHARLAAARLAVGRAEEAWSSAEKAQARSLADLLMAAAERELGPSELAREDSLKTVLAELETELVAYCEAGGSDTAGASAGRGAEIRSALLSAEAEWSAFQREIAARYPVTEGEAFPLDRVQSVLSERTAVVGWLDAEVWHNNHESWCYAIRNSGPVAWAQVASSPSEADSRSPFERTRLFRDLLASSTSSPVVVAHESHDLWGERVEPLLPALEGASELIVIPSGAMVGVPVEALVDDGGALVGERCAVSYVPSGTIHVWLTELAGGDVGSGILLVGDPPYSSAHLAAMEREEDVLVASAEALPGAEMLRSALAGNEDALAALPRLHGTRNEVAAVAAVSEPSSLLLGQEATEQELVQLAESGELGEFETIHIATHALVDDERPERSALVLSQVGLPDPLEAAMAGTRIYDGLVTAKEIVREWDLSADLVTLSACETGLGKEVTGEGYVGLAHAFLQAGARSLLVSLWKVEDKATSLLMRRFYENRFGEYEDERHTRVGQPMSKAEALQEAKQWLRSYTDEHGDNPYEHPYFWSAFILIGERT